jgi:hypothetical protein
MDNCNMGRVTTEATIYNLGDPFTQKRVQTVVVTDAVVDGSVTFLSLPGEHILEVL